MLGCCSYEKDISTEKCIYKNRSIAIWDNKAKFCNREGCFLAILGTVKNVFRLKEEKNIKDTSSENILMTLFLEMGENFIVLLDGSFIIVIYDEINRLLHIFTDRNCTKTMYLAKTETGFLFSDKMTDILTNEEFSLKMDINCLFNIFALPYAYTGEPLCNLYRISGDEYITISFGGAEFFTIEREVDCIKPSEFKFCLPQVGDSYLNCMLSQGKETMILPPHIIASAISQKRIANGHLFFMQKCNSYPELMNENLDFKSFLHNYCCDLLCNLAPFEYKTEKDITDAEDFIINYNLYYKPCLTQVFDLCETYGIKNTSDLLNPPCLKWIFLNQRKKLPVFHSNNIHLAQDIRKTTADLCKNHKEPIFRIINRHRMYAACADVEESFLLFIQRMNTYLKKFRPDLEFF